MAGSPYAVSLGRLRPYFSELLDRGTFAALQAARDLGEFTRILEATSYGPALVGARAAYQGIGLVEVALNRTLVHRFRHAYSATPFAGRGVVGAYLARYDIQNITMLLTAKALDRSLGETEDALISSREIPAGLYAGVLTFDDLRTLLQQPTVEAMAHGLVQFGWGATVLPLVDAFQRSGDIFPIVAALEREYFRLLLEQARFFQGDEWVEREFVRSEIDLRNSLLVLKAKAIEGLALDAVQARWIEGGNVPLAAASDLFAANDVPALAERLKSRYPSLGDGEATYASDASLAGYEAAMRRDHAVVTIERMRLYPLSLGIIFQYLLRNELERNDLHLLAFGLLYRLPSERIQPFLVSPRLL